MCHRPLPRASRRLAVTLAASLGVTSQVACASLPKDYPRQASVAWDRSMPSRLERSLADDLARHPGQSGFEALESGMDAFVARMVLAEAAERTLDLQYYIFHDDLTGRLLLDGLLRAADRGVRVRLLLDDTAAKGRDAAFVDLASHPLIEVRAFNPSAGRSSAAWVLGAAADFDRLNHRMHNKMLVADNEVGVVGGRNVGDEYFAATGAVNFADLDLLAVGPVVQQLSRTFDDYWNSDLAYPIEVLHGSAPDPASVQRQREALAAHRVAAKDSDYARRLKDSDLLRRLYQRDHPLLWGAARVVADRPEKAKVAGAPEAGLELNTQLKAAVTEPRRELLVFTPYFIPGDRGVESFRRLRAQGVRVRIVTNSFASNDVAVVHAGYARYRKELLRLGVELYELKPSLAAVPAEVRRRHGSSQASLHAKAFVLDRTEVFVGSFNLDPRALHLNTELGLVVECPPLAEQLAQQFEQLTRPEATYRLELEAASGDLRWITVEAGREVRYEQDPEVGAWRRFSTWFLSLFAPESLL